MSQQKEKMEPVYFMDLVVENVRCFKDKQVMDLSDGNGKPARWTIILGDNGTGKTTLLKCLASLKPGGGKILSVNPYYDFYPQGFNEYLDFNNNKDKVLSISAKLFSVGKISTKKNKLIKGYGFHIFFNDEEINGGHSSSDDLNLENFFLISYDARRKSGDGSLIQVDSSRYFHNTNISLINPETWLLETDFAIKSSKGNIKKHLQSHYLKVQETLKKLLPDVQDFRVKEITISKIQAAIEVKTPYGWVDMKNLSLGYQTFIAWVVDLAARLFDRYPDSENPLEEPCIVLVDEIDLHLHPKWQRKIVGFLTEIFKNAQFIVTAHSPLIVQAAEDANLVLLKREGDSVRIHNNMDEDIINEWRLDQILTSDLFGLESTRPPKYDPILERKKEILSKDKLNKKDKQELENIAKKLDKLELYDNETNEAVEALKEAIALMKTS